MNILFTIAFILAVVSAFVPMTTGGNMDASWLAVAFLILILYKS